MSQSTFNVPLLAELTDEEREVAMARYQVIVPLLEYPDPSPSKEAWEQAVVKGNCSKKTVRRWLKRYQQHGLPGLARKRRQDKGGRRVVSLEMQHLIEALYLEHGHRTFRNLYRIIKSYAEKEGLPIPTYTIIRDICKALPPTVVAMAREGERAWQDQFEPVLRFESSRPNECWQMDHCQIDLLVVDDTRENVLGRPWLTLALDTYSRAVVGYYLSLTVPSSLSICFALRRAILPKLLPAWTMCGIPERLHIDRGKDFTSKHLAQVAIDLEIQLSFATPYLARAKGKVERFFGTLNMQLWCELPGYVGSNIQDRPPIVQPTLTLQEVEEYLITFLLQGYHQQIHGTTGEQPAARWQQSGFIPRLPASERELDLLLLFTEERVVQRQGIRFYRLDYWAHELVDYIGRRIQVRFDPENIREIVVYHDNRFVCVAATPQLNGLDINLADWRALQARQRRSIREVVRAYRDWLDVKRTALVPFLTPDEVDLAILIERTIAADRSQKLALFPSDHQPALLPSGKKECRDA
jgi:putative transposase